MNLTSNSSSQARDDRVQGWKGIAAYFDKGVRTVQRWEREMGLPVRRLGVGRSETVYALVSDLEAWRADAERRAGYASRPGEEDLPANGEPPAVSPLAFRRWSFAIVAVVALVLATAAGVRWWFFRPGVPATARVEQSTLHVFDAYGRELWSRAFDPPLHADVYVERPWPKPPVLIDDFDGDGQRDLLFLAVSAQRGIFFWFEGGTGKVRYQYEPSPTVTFGERTYPPPWLGRLLFVTRESRPPTVWATWCEGTGGQFPSLLTRMTPDGPSRDVYWSAGYPTLAEHASIGGRPSILVGAANNDTAGAALAIFDVGSVRGSSPAITDDKTCKDCPPGRPRVFLEFPALDLIRLSGGAPYVSLVRTDARGNLRVSVNQGANLPDETRPAHGEAFYWFDASLRLLKAELSQEFPAMHRRFELAKLVDHPFGPRDQAELMPVRYWDGHRLVPLKVGESPLEPKPQAHLQLPGLRGGDRPPVER